MIETGLAMHDINRRVETATRMLNKVVRGISANVKVKIVITPIGNIAMTDGQTIYLDSDLINDFSTDIAKDPKKSARTIAKLKGLVYHEMGHIIWSPRKNSNLMKQVSGLGLFRHWNILEDQRIEQLLCSRYHSHRFLVPALVDFMLINNDADEWQKIAHPFVSGRTYLPYNVRKIAHDNWEGGIHEADRITEIIDEYAVLTFPRNNSEAVALIEEFASLVSNPIIFDDHGSIGNGTPERSTEAAKAADDVKENIKRKKEEDAKEEAANKEPKDSHGNESETTDGDSDSDTGEDSEDETGDAGDSGEGAESDGDGHEDSEDSGDTGDSGKPSEGDTEGNEGKSDSDTDSDKGNTPGSGGGSGDSGVKNRRVGDASNAGDSGESFMDALDDFDDKLCEEDVDNGTLEEHVKEFSRGMLRPTKVEAEAAPKAVRPVPENIRPMAKKIANDLGKLTAKFAPSIKRKQPFGDINVMDYKTRKPGQTFNVFDQFKRDQRDQAAVEVVVLVDVSGSTNSIADKETMRNVLSNELLAAWVLKRAFDQLPQCACSVLLFDDKHPRWLYHPHEKAKPTEHRVVSPGYGTNPYWSLVEAAKLFDSSNAKHKMIVILTDGDWSRHHASGISPEDVISSYNANGITTVLLGIGDIYMTDGKGPVHYHGDHHCLIATDIMNIMDMPKIIAEITKNKLFASVSSLNR
jgi:hypothetical protein